MDTRKVFGQMTRSALNAAVGVAAPAILISAAATAHADDNYQQFAAATGGIRCILNGQDAPQPIAMCQIGDHSYAVPLERPETRTAGRARPDPMRVAISGSTKASRPTSRVATPPWVPVPARGPR